MNNLFFAFWFFLPSGIANMTPVFASHMPFFKKYSYPLDFYKKINGKRIFGDHKTIRGIILGVFMGIVSVFLQQYLYLQFSFLRDISGLNYSNTQPLILGGLLGLGALSGDLFKSFLKRQLNITEGNSWIPFDQLDYIFGGIIFSYLYVQFAIKIYAFIFAIYFALHILTTIIGFYLHLKEKPI